MRVLGELKPGLDEKLYENAPVIELAKLDVQPEQQRAFPVHHDGKFTGKLIHGPIVEDVVVDAKMVTAFTPRSRGPDVGLPEYHRAAPWSSPQFPISQTADQKGDSKRGRSTR